MNGISGTVVLINDISGSNNIFYTFFVTSNVRKTDRSSNVTQWNLSYQNARKILRDPSGFVE